MSNDTFQFNGPIADLVKKEVKKEEGKAAPITHRFYDHRTEILDIDEGGSMKRNEAGRKAQRFASSLRDLGVVTMKALLSGSPS